jgi:hypothetical protein
VERRDVEAAVHARRELGAAYEDEIDDSLLAKIAQKLEERRPVPVARRGAITPLALGALGCAVGATAILMTHGGDWLVPVVWIAIAWLVGQVARYR